MEWRLNLNWSVEFRAVLRCNCGVTFWFELCCGVSCCGVSCCVVLCCGVAFLTVLWRLVFSCAVFCVVEFHFELGCGVSCCVVCCVWLLCYMLWCGVGWRFELFCGVSCCVVYCAVMLGYMLWCRVEWHASIGLDGVVEKNIPNVLLVLIWSFLTVSQNPF